VHIVMYLRERARGAAPGGWAAHGLGAVWGRRRESPAPAGLPAVAPTVPAAFRGVPHIVMYLRERARGAATCGWLPRGRLEAGRGWSCSELLSRGVPHLRVSG
jgi:hypothetical protein